MSLQHTYFATIDLKEPTREVTWDTLASVGDEKAHKFVVRTVENKVPVDITGATVLLKAYRQDKATREIEGKVEDNAAVAELDYSCYEIPGTLKVTILIKKDGVTFSAARVYMLIDTANGDAVVNPSGVIPSLQDIYDELDAMKKAVKDTNEATSAANAAAKRANDAADTVDQLKNDAQKAISDAQDAIDDANSITESWENASVQSTTVAPSDPASVTLSDDENGNKVLHFSIPKGENGDNPYVGDNGNWFVANKDTGVKAKGETGDDGITPHIGDNGNWWIGDSDTGTPARGPAGQNGTGSGTVTAIQIGETVYGPDNVGVVQIENIDSMPSGGAAGQVLAKKSDSDGDVEWKDIPDQEDELPVGGTSGQILAKKTDADGDAEWVDPPEGTLKSVCGKEADENGNVDLDAADVGAVSVPDEDVPAYGEATGINADMLGGAPASDYARKSDIPAADPDAGAGLPAGGTAGQILAKKSGADGDVEWKDETKAASYDQSLNKADDVTFNSVSTVQPINAGKLGGKDASAYVLAASFEEWTFALDDGSTVTKKVIVVD